jgi:ATP-dependent protease HslVU (ClpYQ) ATPase subunit
VQEDDSDAELKDRRVKVAVKQPAESDAQNQPEVQIIEAQIADKFSALTKARQDKREASKNTKTASSKPVSRLIQFLLLSSNFILSTGANYRCRVQHKCNNCKGIV